MERLSRKRVGQLLCRDIPLDYKRSKMADGRYSPLFIGRTTLYSNCDLTIL